MPIDKQTIQLSIVTDLLDEEYSIKIPVNEKIYWFNRSKARLASSNQSEWLGY